MNVFCREEGVPYYAPEEDARRVRCEFPVISRLFVIQGMKNIYAVVAPAPCPPKITLRGDPEFVRSPDSKRHRMLRAYSTQPKKQSKQPNSFHVPQHKIFERTNGSRIQKQVIFVDDSAFAVIGAIN